MALVTVQRSPSVSSCSSPPSSVSAECIMSVKRNLVCYDCKRILLSPFVHKISVKHYE
jgi:hypothetical protein